VENVAVEGACMENDGRMVLDRVSPKGSACVFCPSFCGWIKNKTGGKPVHSSSLVRPKVVFLHTQYTSSFLTHLRYIHTVETGPRPYYP
jgi:hypothetical protein